MNVFIEKPDMSLIIERRQPGMPFEILYMLKYAFVGEISFLRFRRKFLLYDYDSWDLETII